MKRWHEEYARTYREWKKHYLGHVEHNINFTQAPGSGPYEIDCACDQQKGRFRKKRPLGCSKARCQLCKAHKFPKREPTRHERLSEYMLNEEIQEL